MTSMDAHFGRANLCSGPKIRAKNSGQKLT